MPGSGHLLSGQTLYLKLREARIIDDLLIRLADGSIAGGIKMANGTNPRRAAPFPGTRGKAAAIVREQYIKALEYRAKVQAANGDAAKLPPRDLRMEALVEALDGKRIIQHHTHRHDDILTVLRLADEFKFKVVLHHVSDGWMVAKEVAASKQVIGASVIVIDVREKDEWDAGHIAQATFLPRGRLEGRVEELVPDKNATIVTH